MALADEDSLSKLADEPVDLPRLVRLSLELREKWTERVRVAVLELLPALHLERLQLRRGLAAALDAMFAFGLVVAHVARGPRNKRRDPATPLAEVVRKSFHELRQVAE